MSTNPGPQNTEGFFKNVRSYSDSVTANLEKQRFKCGVPNLFSDSLNKSTGQKNLIFTNFWGWFSSIIYISTAYKEDQRDVICHISGQSLENTADPVTIGHCSFNEWSFFLSKSARDSNKATNCKVIKNTLRTSFHIHNYLILAL